MVLRYWLRNWMRQRAGQAVRERVTDTLRDELGKTTDQAAGEAAGCGPEGGEPAPCQVGVVFALGIESGGLEDLLGDAVSVRGHGFVASRGVLAHRNLVVVRSGSGAEAAAQATEALIQGHHPEWVISAGFAGALVPELARHDLVMADSLTDLAGNRLAIDLKVDPAELARAPGVHVGRLLSADHVVRLPSEKRSLGQEHEALAVDMETFAVAEVCRQRQVRFLAVRIITDAVDDELPPDVQTLTKQKTTAARLGAAVGAIWNRPASVKDMYRLRENALVASDRLAKFLHSTLKQLIPLPPAP